ncbi:MAG: hypothetical protein OHK0015_48320 [Chloroflexi bacterium OHK40]
MATRSLQELFVDRLRQLERFRKSLEGSSGRKIILVAAGPGMGKSWLLRRFVQESSARGARSVLLDFSDGQAYDVLTLVRRFRDALGPEYFNRLTAAINEATAPRLVISDDGEPGPGAQLNFAGAQLGDVTIGEVAGRTIVKDNLFIVQTDNPLLLQAIEDRVTQAFFACLADLTAATSALFLFDSYERTSQEEGERWVANAADRWIQRELLSRIRDGRLTNTVVVLAGRRLPSFDAEWAGVVGQLPLELFTVEDVAQYLRENRQLAALTDGEVQTLYSAIQGNPQLLGIIGDNLEQAQRPVADDEW